MVFRDFVEPLIATYIDFKYVTDLRRCDILRIKLNQLRDDGIHVYASKSKKNIVIGWSDLLAEAVRDIRKLKRHINGLYLFSNQKGQPHTDIGFSTMWQRTMRKALDKEIIKERFRDQDIRAKTGSDTDLLHASELPSKS